MQVHRVFIHIYGIGLTRSPDRNALLRTSRARPTPTSHNLNMNNEVKITKLEIDIWYIAHMCAAKRRTNDFDELQLFPYTCNRWSVRDLWEILMARKSN